MYANNQFQMDISQKGQFALTEKKEKLIQFHEDMGRSFKVNIENPIGVAAVAMKQNAIHSAGLGKGMKI